MEQGDNLTLSSMTSTLHLGAHCDAPSHYDSDGLSMEACDLSVYYGECQVLTVQGEVFERRVSTNNVHLGKVIEPRVLIRTGSFPDPENWNSDFYGLCPGLIEALAEKGVQLIGIDTPSMDPEDSKELPAHHAIAKSGMRILEGVILDQVNPGNYLLCAFPLKMEDADASPVRAVLIVQD